MSIVGTAEWNALCAAYATAQAASNGKGWKHANCDHAYGYCTETATNTYQGASNA